MDCSDRAGTDVDVGVRYCTAHNGIANEDMATCDFAENDGDRCSFRPLFYRAARKRRVNVKRWRVVFVTGLYDDDPLEVARTWSERGAWRAHARQLNTPRVGWYEVRRTNEHKPTGVQLDEKLDAMMRERVTSWPDHPTHDAIVRRGDD